MANKTLNDETLQLTVRLQAGEKEDEEEQDEEIGGFINSDGEVVEWDGSKLLRAAHVHNPCEKYTFIYLKVDFFVSVSFVDLFKYKISEKRRAWFGAIWLLLNTFDNLGNTFWTPKLEITF